MSRLTLGFHGVLDATLDLDPEEYRGLTRPEASKAILEALLAINPRVSFFEADIEAAIDELDRACVEICGDCGSEINGGHGQCQFPEDDDDSPA